MVYSGENKDGGIGRKVVLHVVVSEILLKMRVEQRLILKKKKYSRSLLEHGKADFIPGEGGFAMCIRITAKGCCNGRYSLGRWEFTAKEQGEGWWMENY